MAENTGSLDPKEMVEAASAMREQLTDLLQQASERLELERRIHETPWLVLGVAAGAGFVLGGGLWPALRPFVKGLARAAMTPSNLLAIGAAIGAMKAAGAQQEEEMDMAPPPPETAH